MIIVEICWVVALQSPWEVVAQPSPTPQLVFSKWHEKIMFDIQRPRNLITSLREATALLDRRSEEKTHSDCCHNS